MTNFEERLFSKINYLFEQIENLVIKKINERKLKKVTVKIMEIARIIKKYEENKDGTMRNL